MPQVIIQQVIAGPIQAQPFTSHGKTVEVTEWMINALVDGTPMPNIKLRAFSKKVHWLVQPNGVAVCEPPKTHNGQIEYKIITPSDQNGRVNSGTPTPAYTPPVSNQQFYKQPTPATASGNKPVTNPSKYTQEELEDVMMRAVEFSKETLGAVNEQAIVSFAATYVIQACKEGIKIPINKTSSAKEEAPSETEKIWEVIYERGLADRVNMINIPETTLVLWWKQSGADINAFVVRLNYEITQAEAGIKDGE
jgi:hypothetical protein